MTRFASSSSSRAPASAFRARRRRPLPQALRPVPRSARNTRSGLSIPPRDERNLCSPRHGNRHDAPAGQRDDRGNERAKLSPPISPPAIQAPLRQPLPPPASRSPPSTPIDLSAKSNWRGSGAGLANTALSGSRESHRRRNSQAEIEVGLQPGRTAPIARGTPVIIGNRLFVGTSTGKLSLSLLPLHAPAGPSTPTLQFAPESSLEMLPLAQSPWGFPATQKETPTPSTLPQENSVWKTHPEDHIAAMITGTPNYYDGTVYFGISSLEEVFGGQPKYECCSFRGSVVALNASTGAHSLEDLHNLRSRQAHH